MLAVEIWTVGIPAALYVAGDVLEVKSDAWTGTSAVR